MVAGPPLSPGRFAMTATPAVSSPRSKQKPGAVAPKPADTVTPMMAQYLAIKAEHAGDCGIVYCLTRNKVEQTADWLAERGINALAYHAGLERQERTRRQERFVDLADRVRAGRRARRGSSS